LPESNAVVQTQVMGAADALATADHRAAPYDPLTPPNQHRQNSGRFDFAFSAWILAALQRNIRATI
jgi:hypothetical protein